MTSFQNRPAFRDDRAMPAAIGRFPKADDGARKQGQQEKEEMKCVRGTTCEAHCP